MKRLIQRVAALTAALCVAAACVAPVYAETANTEKEENVYVSLAGDGSVADIYIVNMFALDSKTEIRDYGAYSSVRNLTSEEMCIRDRINYARHFQSSQLKAIGKDFLAAKLV